MASALDRLAAEIRACRVCVDAPKGRPLPHEPRPVLRVSRRARLCVVGQAPGTRVHACGVPFNDASGERLRNWMGVSRDEFYDTRRIAIVPMGFCFPGHDANGGDLPPRRECAHLWRKRLFGELVDLELVLLVGQHAQRWHLAHAASHSVTETVASWREILARPGKPKHFPLPHPSWRNNAWLNANPWFERELLPHLRAKVRRVLD
jgi:uracil-DNA glycosylase